MKNVINERALLPDQVLKRHQYIMCFRYGTIVFGEQIISIIDQKLTYSIQLQSLLLILPASINTKGTGVEAVTKYRTIEDVWPLPRIF
jgi:hypothetical protein